jgi:hypothetical protein
MQARELTGHMALAGTILKTASIPCATEEECREAFDHAARAYKGISGEEFLKLLDEGKLDLSDSKVQHVLTMLSFVR